VATIAGQFQGGASPSYVKVPDGTPALSANFTTPAGIAYDPAGNLYIVDEVNVYRVDATSRAITTVIAAGRGMVQVKALPNGTLLMQDFINHVVCRVDPDGCTPIVGKAGVCGKAGDGGPASEATICAPYGIAIDPTNPDRFWIASSGNNMVRGGSACL
jgi:DNA-binding beta-propeller fold protein YncE